MKNNTLLLFTILCCSVCCTHLGAQNRAGTISHVEDLPRRAIDTLHTEDPDTRIILYSNNTWSYYRPNLRQRYDELEVYSRHWDTTQIFSYRAVRLEDLPSNVELNLISTLSDFSPPIKGKVFSKYGRRGRRNHNGVDIPLKIGEPIYATFDGKVRYSKYNTGGYGNLVILRHENGLETWYAHLSKSNVGENEYVKAGQIIGYGGNTGRSRGPHLHFETRYFDQTFDPEHLIDFENGNIKYMTFALEKSYLNINSRASDELEDHDFDDNFFASADGGEITSEEILERIAQGQQTPARTQPQQPQTASVGQSNAVYHTIVSGDVLGKIAIKYGVSIDQICRLNNINRNTTLRIGKKLRVK